MKINNQKDKDLIESLCPAEHEKFIAWFAELNKVNSERKDAFYSGTKLEDSTGVICWFDYFVDGLKPSEALDEDLLHV